jgi:hypothetical protein
MLGGLVINKSPRIVVLILNLLDPRDHVMADIENDMPAGVGLNIPPFSNGALSDETETRRIAALRVRVERAIGRIKNFKIIKNVFPLKMSSDLNKIWIICSYLTLFYPPSSTHTRKT